MKNSQIITLSATQDTIPRSKLGAGTITSVGTKITGAGTLFSKEALNDWIYIKAQNAVRRIVNIVSDTDITIDEPFAIALAGSAYNITPASRLREIAGFVNGTAAITIDNVNFSVGATFSFNKMQRETSWSKDFIDPIAIDATAIGASIRVDTHS